MERAYLAQFPYSLVWHRVAGSPLSCQPRLHPGQQGAREGSPPRRVLTPEKAVPANAVEIEE